jgi:hypothetical protein
VSPEPIRPPYEVWGACDECKGLDGKHEPWCTGNRSK